MSYNNHWCQVCKGSGWLVFPEPGRCEECLGTGLTLREMYAISLLQPWAWAMLTQGKDTENRDWALWHNMRGHRVLIHASKGWDNDGWDYLDELWQQGKIKDLPEPDDLIRGALVGSLVFTDSRLYGSILKPDHWQFGKHCWTAAEPIALKEPLPCRGFPAFWPVAKALFPEPVEKVERPKDKGQPSLLEVPA